jgi:hypothetical protein
MREKIAGIVSEAECSDDRGYGPIVLDPDAIADAIIAALPEMIPDLVWLDRGERLRCGNYIIFHFTNGSYVEYVNLALGGGMSLEGAKAAANAHHRASIMAAFTGETT